jgi:hypothetical protein
MKRLALDNKTTLADIANQAFRESVGKKGVASSYSEKDVKTFAKDLKTQVDRMERKRKR